MKKILVLFSLLTAMNDGWTQNEAFEKYITDSKNIELPLFEKVLPGVDLIIETSQITIPPSKRIVSSYDTIKYILPQDFNQLYDKVKMKAQASEVMIIEAFVQIFYWFREIEGSKNITTKFFITVYEGLLFNYEVKFEAGGRKFKLLVIFLDNHIIRVEEFVNDDKVGAVFPKIRLSNH
jgi:hypothetical protein